MYLLTFPVLHARVDALWLIGAALRRAVGGLPVTRSAGVIAWVAAACVDAINGSATCRYFLRAAPALALRRPWPGPICGPAVVR